MRIENLELENIWMNIKSLYFLNYWMIKMWFFYLDLYSLKILYIWVLKDTLLEREEWWFYFEGKMMVVG